MKLLLLLLITVAIVANGAEGLTCYGHDYVNATEEYTVLDKAEKVVCHGTTEDFCYKEVKGEQFHLSELIGEKVWKTHLLLRGC